MKESSKFWDRYAESYDLSVEKRYQTTYQEMIRLSKNYLKKDDILLDVGCGTGISDLEFASFVKRIDAFDISEKMVDIATSKAANDNIKNISFRVGKLTDDEHKSAVYDVIVAFNVILFCNKNEKTVERIYELLKPGGIFLSATDCYAEKNFLMNTALKILTFLRIFPYTTSFSCKSLEEEIKKPGFSIIEKKILFKKPVNYYISAKK